MDKKFNHEDYEINQRDILYQGVLRLARYKVRHQLFNGNLSDFFVREVLERPAAVAVLPYDPLLDRVILIEQFRVGAIADPKSPWLIEIPAGIIDPGEKPEAVAHRETLEEAGCKLFRLEFICEYFVSPGGSNEYLNLFCGQVDASDANGIHGLKEENEDIRVLNLSTNEAFAKLRSNQIKTSPALMALFWLQMNKQRLQENWG